MINFENSDNKRCLVCDQANIHLQKIKINRTFREDNIVSFDICTNCLYEMFIDIEKQLHFLDCCKKVLVKD